MTIPTPAPPQTVKHASGVASIANNSETMRITGPDGGAVWLQNGQLYDDVGKVIETPPAWFEAEFRKLSPAMQRVHALGERKVDVGTAMKAEAEAIDHEPEENLEGMNKADLLKVAEMESVEVSDHDTKAVIINKILAARE